MTFTRYFFFLLSCICCLTTTAQVYQGSRTYTGFTLRFAPLSFLEGDGNVSVGAGYRINQHWGATLDPGYIFFRPYESGENRETMAVSGIKIRSDIRYFPGRDGKRFFIGPEFHYKYIRSRELADFGFNCVGGQCDYFQQARFSNIKRETGISLKFGTTLRLSGRFETELYAGMGVKRKRFTRRDIPTGGSFVSNPETWNFFVINTREDGSYLILPAGARLVFRL